MDIVNLGENKPAARGKYFYIFFGFPANICQCPVGKGSLGIDASAPENQVFAEFLFQPFRLHLFCGNLYRVDDVHAYFDQVRDKIVYTAAGVQKNVQVAVFFNKSIYFLVKGLYHFPVHL